MDNYTAINILVPTSAYLPSSLMITTLANLLNNLLRKVNLYNFSLYLLLPSQNMCVTDHILCHLAEDNVSCCSGPTHLEDAKEGKIAAGECTRNKRLPSLNYMFAE